MSPLRTIRQISADPTIGQDHVVVPNSQRADYEEKGCTLVEELEGNRCLLKRPAPVVPPVRVKETPKPTPPKAAPKKFLR